MHIAYLILAILVFAASLVCTIIIAIDAFQYEWWAGLLFLLIPIYTVYWAVFEFEHERKWWLVAGSFAGISVAALFFELYMGVPVMHPHSPSGFG